MKAIVKFINGRQIKALVHFCNDDWTESVKKEGSAYVSGSYGNIRKQMRQVTDEERKDGFEWACSAAAVDSFLLLNKVHVYDPMTMEDIKTGNGPVKYQNDKVFVWYEFVAGNRTYHAANLSKAKKFIETWLNYDCPALLRYETNSSDTAHTMMGCEYPTFTDTVVSGSNFSEDMTVEEAKALAAGCGEQTYIGEKLTKWLAAKNMSDAELAEATKRVDTAEAEMQAIIDAHHDELVAAETKTPEDPNAFDCGWLNWYGIGKLGEDLELLKAVGKRTTEMLNINIPQVVQSIYHQADAGKIVVTLISDNTPYKVRFETHLD